MGTAWCENEEGKEGVSAFHGAVAYRPPEPVASAAPSIDSWPYARHHLLSPFLLLAVKSRPALQPVIRAAAVAVLPAARGPAGARRALHPQRRGRDPAVPVHRRGGCVGTAALPDLPDLRWSVAPPPRHARARLTAPRAPLCRRTGGGRRPWSGL